MGRLLKSARSGRSPVTMRPWLITHACARKSPPSPLSTPITSLCPSFINRSITAAVTPLVRQLGRETPLLARSIAIRTRPIDPSTELSVRVPGLDSPTTRQTHRKGITYSIVRADHSSAAATPTSRRSLQDSASHLETRCIFNRSLQRIASQVNVRRTDQDTQ